MSSRDQVKFPRVGDTQSSFVRFNCIVCSLISLDSINVYTQYIESGKNRDARENSDKTKKKIKHQINKRDKKFEDKKKKG